MNNNNNHGLRPRVKLHYLRFPIALFLGYMRNVVTNETGNASYTTPIPALTMVTTALNDLDAKTQAALNRGRIELAVRNAAFAAAGSLSRQLANYVQLTANGDINVLLSQALRRPAHRARHSQWRLRLTCA